MRPEPRKREFLVSSAIRSLGSVVTELAPGDPDAVEQGRVFVDEQRVVDRRHRVQPGARVTWYARRSSVVEPDDLPFSIIARRGDWVVVSKPSGWSCEPDRTGRAASLRDAVANELGAARVHVLTRLDVGVSGLVLIGLSPRACRLALSLQNEHRLGKDYYALVSGAPVPSITWDGPPCANRYATTQSRRLGEPCVVRSSAPTICSLLSIKPITGRKHQIRIHAAHHGYPLLGDVRYGGLTRVVKPDGGVVPVKRVMLHAYRLVMPLEKDYWTTHCLPPRDFVTLWTTLGGDPALLSSETTA